MLFRLCVWIVVFGFVDGVGVSVCALCLVAPVWIYVVVWYFGSGWLGWVRLVNLFVCYYVILRGWV